MTMRYVNPGFVLKSADQKTGVFWGYASTFAVDRAQERILPGAFTQTLQRWQARKKRWPYLYLEHHQDEMVGVSLDLRQDDQGLYIKGKILKDDIPSAAIAWQWLQDGVRGLSIGFMAGESFYKDGVRHIQSLDLLEISIVREPCNSQALIHEYKHMHTGHDPGVGQEAILQRLRALKKTLQS